MNISDIDSDRNKTDLMVVEGINLNSENPTNVDTETSDSHELTGPLVLNPELAAKEVAYLRKQAQRRTAPSIGHISMRRKSQ